jgi:hypothetical protein
MVVGSGAVQLEQMQHHISEFLIHYSIKNFDKEGYLSKNMFLN